MLLLLFLMDCVLMIDFAYEEGKAAKHSLISPKLATLYLTTSGKSLARYISI